MRKLFIIILFAITVQCFAQRSSIYPVGIVRFQTSSDTWDFNGDVFHPIETITGNVTIKNAIIEANPYQQIFDTTVTLINCKTREFSTAWFGASPSNPDNSVYLQKAISTCISNNITNLYCADSYKFSESLKAFKLVKDQYTGFGLNFYGDGDHWNQKQTLSYTGSDFAYGVQVAKGGCFRGITLRGKNAGSGIVVDYDGTKNVSGSTGFTIENCYVGNFDVNYDISPNGKTYNADIIRLNNIHSGKCNIGFRSGQAQEKGNEINGIYSWDSCKILIQIGRSGKVQAGNYIVRGGNIAGYCEQILDVNLSGWNTFSIQGLYAESVKTLGNVYAHNVTHYTYLPPANLQDLEIQFIPGSQILFKSNSAKVRISNSAFWFYTGECCQQMNFQGPFIWDNNDCGNCEINDNQIQYIIPGPPNLTTYTQGNLKLNPL